MKWEDFVNLPLKDGYDGQILTDIECPKCGKKIYFNSTIVLTSYPAKYQYWCRCGWSSYTSTKWGDPIFTL